MKLFLTRFRLLLAIIVALSATVPSWAQNASSDSNEFKDGAWVSYRDAYRKMIGFDKYGGAKQYLQNNVRVRIIDKKTSVDGVRLSLEGKKTHLNLPLDGLGRATFPMLKSAYDDNAELKVNRPDSVVAIEYRVSIVTRPDGNYEINGLRAACDQALHFSRYQDLIIYSLRHCEGVRFVFAKDQSNARLKLKTSDSAESALPLADGKAFADDAYADYKISEFRFSESDKAYQINSSEIPLAIIPIFN